MKKLASSSSKIKPSKFSRRGPRRIAKTAGVRRAARGSRQPRPKTQARPRRALILATNTVAAMKPPLEMSRLVREDNSTSAVPHVTATAPVDEAYVTSSAVTGSEGGRSRETELVLSPVVAPSYQHDMVWRRQIMWVGVSLSMLAIVIAWALTLRASLAVPPVDSLNPLPMTNLKGDFSTLYQQVNRSLNQLQATVPPVKAADTPPPAPTLTPDEIERLRQKLDAMTNTPATTIPPSASTLLPPAPPVVGPHL